MVQGLVGESELERLTLANAVRYLRNTSRSTARRERAETYFVPVDWRWVSARTHIADVRETKTKRQQRLTAAAQEARETTYLRKEADDNRELRESRMSRDENTV